MFLILEQVFSTHDLLILATTWGYIQSHYPHVTVEETEAQKGEVTCPTFSWNGTSRYLSLEPVLLSQETSCFHLVQWSVVLTSKV